jgi:hypothetical protein
MRISIPSISKGVGVVGRQEKYIWLYKNIGDYGRGWRMTIDRNKAGELVSYVIIEDDALAIAFLLKYS